MVLIPKNYSQGATGVNWANPLAAGLDLAILPDGSYEPRNLCTGQIWSARNAFSTGGSASAFAGIDQGGNSYYTNNGAGTSDRFDTIMSVGYGQLHSGLVIANFNTIVPSLFPSLLYIDGNDGNNFIHMITRHTTNALFLQVTIAGTLINFSTTGAAVIPGTPQVFAYTLDGTAAANKPILYVDGRVFVQGLSTGIPAPITTFPSQRVSLMNSINAGTNMMQGHIFGWFHWKRVLTDTEIASVSTNTNWLGLINYR